MSKTQILSIVALVSLTVYHLATGSISFAINDAVTLLGAFHLDQLRAVIVAVLGTGTTPPVPVAPVSPPVTR